MIWMKCNKNKLNPTEGKRVSGQEKERKTGEKRTFRRHGFLCKSE